MTNKLEDPFIRKRNDKIRTFESHSAQETRILGFSIGEHASATSVILLTGEMGSGKTVLAQGIGSGLGVSTIINSPTFVLVNQYLDGRLPFCHADLYRLENLEEIAQLALLEVSQDGVLAVEWPERAAGDLPTDNLHLRFMEGRSESSRMIHCQASGPCSEQLLSHLDLPVKLRE